MSLMKIKAVGPDNSEETVDRLVAEVARYSSRLGGVCLDRNRGVAQRTGRANGYFLWVPGGNRASETLTEALARVGLRVITDEEDS
jgi:hypothetical protein